MYLDERTEFADGATAAGTAAATTIVGDTIDLGATPTLRDIGNGRPLYLVVQVDDAVLASGGAANLTLKLVSDSTSNLTTSPTTHWTTGPVAKALLVAGKRWVVALPIEATYERYLGVTKTPDTNDTTAGLLSAFLTMDVNAYVNYPDAI